MLLMTSPPTSRTNPCNLTTATSSGIQASSSNVLDSGWSYACIGSGGGGMTGTRLGTETASGGGGPVMIASFSTGGGGATGSSLGTGGSGGGETLGTASSSTSKRKSTVSASSLSASSSSNFASCGLAAMSMILLISSICR